MPDVAKVLDEIGRLGADSPTDWATVAMGCLDQAMLSVHVQDQIEALIRAAGVDVDKRTQVPGATRHGNMMHGPIERERCDKHPKRWRISRWDWRVPEDGDHVCAMQSDSEPVIVRECAECIVEYEAEESDMLTRYG